MSDYLLPLGILGFGFWAAWHCPRSGLREFRAGVGRGILGDYRRDVEPLRFWATIILTFAAGLVGLLFMLFGLALFLGNLVGGK